MIGVKPLFSGRSLGDGDSADLRRRRRRARRQARSRSAGCTTSCCAIETHYQWYQARRQLELRAGQDDRARRRRQHRRRAPTSPARISLPVTLRPLSARSLDRRSERPGDLGRLRCRLVCRGQRRHAGHAGDRARQAANTAPGDTMTVAVTARTAGRVTLNVIGDRLLATQTADVQAGRRQAAAAGRQRLGHRRLCGRDACAGRSTRRRSACPAAPSACSGSRSTARRRRSRSTCKLPALMRPNTTLRIPVKVDGPRGRRGGAHRRRRGRCRHPQSHQLQAAGAGRLLSRPAPLSRRDPRPLRPTDRRHAGHARPDPHRRRRRRRRAARQPADAAAAGALFRHRHGRRRRHGRGRVRHPGLRRHRRA